MWRWDQGHLEYFQFDAIRQIAAFVEQHDFKAAPKAKLVSATGLSFSAPPTHTPWRNYSRALKLCLLVSEVGDQAQATPVAHVLSTPGAVTCDEYMHFLACAFSSPSPALNDWNYAAQFRYPLLFALKYLLTKAIITDEPFASLNEILGAFGKTGFDGDEDATQFIAAVGNRTTYEAAGNACPENLRRQARESLRVIAQISYLHIRTGKMFVSLDAKDAHEIFEDLAPILGPHDVDGDAEIRRLAALFSDGATSIVFEYPNTVTNEVVQSGFREGTKVEKTHITIERNANLRREFFAARPTAICDVCTVNTSLSYPWTKRVMDLHHLLPLSSGTRVEASGTTFDDLVPVCPSCHRAIHRYYDIWLSRNNRDDFKNRREARNVYQSMKADFPGLIHA
jgi:hypothetical protein